MCRTVFWLENHFKQDQVPGNWWIANQCPPQQSPNQTGQGVSSKWSSRSHSKISQATAAFASLTCCIWKKTWIGLVVSFHSHLQNKSIPLKCEQHPIIEKKINRQRFQCCGHVCRVKASRPPCSQRRGKCSDQHQRRCGPSKLNTTWRITDLTSK